MHDEAHGPSAARPAPEDRTPWQAGVTVLANAAIDRIDGAPPSPGGCPSFAAAALETTGGGRVVARAARRDEALFAPILTGGPSGAAGTAEACSDGSTAHARPVVELVPADRTAAFSLRYRGDDRTMHVDALGPVWTPGDVDAARITTRWVHLAPLLRSDFPAATVRHLVARGHRIAFDGQGLVRAATLGPLRTDGAVDRRVLDAVRVLKLADDEAAVIAGGDAFGLDDARALGVPELLITHGSRGADLYLLDPLAGPPESGARAIAHHRIPPAWTVEGVHATGAGDVFTVAYVAGRAAGRAPQAAATAASRVVAAFLQERREAAVT